MKRTDGLNVIQEIIKRPGNEICADCKVSNPNWASVTYGCFICVNCSIQHRQLKHGRVKSVTLDRWTTLNLSTMNEMGNNKLNDIYEGNLSSNLIKNDDNIPGSLKYAINKYDLHSFMTSNDIKQEENRINYLIAKRKRTKPDMLNLDNKLKNNNSKSRKNSYNLRKVNNIEPINTRSISKRNLSSKQSNKDNKNKERNNSFDLTTPTSTVSTNFCVSTSFPASDTLSKINKLDNSSITKKISKISIKSLNTDLPTPTSSISSPFSFTTVEQSFNDLNLSSPINITGDEVSSPLSAISETSTFNWTTTSRKQSITNAAIFLPEEAIDTGFDSVFGFNQLQNQNQNLFNNQIDNKPIQLDVLLPTDYNNNDPSNLIYYATLANGQTVVLNEEQAAKVLFPPVGNTALVVPNDSFYSNDFSINVNDNNQLINNEISFDFINTNNFQN